MSRSASGRVRDGFTLIEVAVATAVVGIGVAALMACLVAGTRANRAGQQLAQAVLLIQEARERTLKLPFSDPTGSGSVPGPEAGENPQVAVDDLDDLIGVTFNPPQDACGVPLTGMPGWSQTFTLTWRDPNHLTSVVAAGSSDIIHVQVDAVYRGQTVQSAGWLVARR
jgi:prepilin-type N-terminal cleavage/methylation domain-containing protein